MAPPWPCLSISSHRRFQTDLHHLPVTHQHSSHWERRLNLWSASLSAGSHSSLLSTRSAMKASPLPTSSSACKTILSTCDWPLALLTPTWKGLEDLLTYYSSPNTSWENQHRASTSVHSWDSKGSYWVSSLAKELLPCTKLSGLFQSPAGLFLISAVSPYLVPTAAQPWLLLFLRSRNRQDFLALAHLRPITLPWF